jgi:hypothetical protein
MARSEEAPREPGAPRHDRDFVLDASIAAAWVLEDEQSDLADQVIDSLIGMRSADFAD